MQAIETTGQINEMGQLTLSIPLKVVNRKVKVILLIEEDDEISDYHWLQAATQNPAFDFLKEEAENIYSIHDGKPISHEV